MSRRAKFDHESQVTFAGFASRYAANPFAEMSLTVSANHRNHIVELLADDMTMFSVDRKDFIADMRWLLDRMERMDVSEDAPLVRRCQAFAEEDRQERLALQRGLSSAEV